MNAEYLTFICSTAGDDAGIYATSFDATAGALTSLVTTTVERPTFLAVHPDGTHLYAANRTDGGTVSAFRIDDDGSLTRLNDQSSEGVGPCYVSVDATGRYVFVSNYTEGTIAMLPVKSDGSLGEPCDAVRHEGSGVDPDRQESPHPHSIVPGPQNQFVYVPDLGTDRVMCYRIDFDWGKLDPVESATLESADGSGPRHVTFAPDSNIGYLVNELDSTLSAVSHDPVSGRLEIIDTVSTLPPDVMVQNKGADVHVHPTGRWVYASNRGHDSVAVFETETGQLRCVEHVSAGGQTPRDFALDPTARWLLVENRESDTVIPFAIDDETGRLAPTDSQLVVPSPTCAVFVTR